MTMHRRSSETDILGFASIGLLLALAALSGCTGVEKEAEGASADNEESAVAVEAATVESRELSRTIEVSTTLAANRTLTVTPEVGGVAEKIYRDQGDTVESGDPLVRVASVDYSLAVDSAQSQKSAAQAGIKQAKARLKTARKQYERFEKLYADEVIAKAQFEEVEAAYESAKAAYESAKARAERASTGVEQARTRVEDTVVRAPFGGHVVRRMVDEGAVLRPMASPVMVLIDDDPIRAEAAVGELKVPEVREGMAATVEVDAYPDREFEGKVAMVNRQINPRTREAAIRVVLPNEEGELRAGMSGKVRIELGSRERLVVPRTAIFDRQGSQAAVYVVESGSAHRRTIHIEPGFESHLPVTDGLSGGERVVTWGADQLGDGTPVEVRAKSPEKNSESPSAQEASTSEEESQ